MSDQPDDDPMAPMEMVQAAEQLQASLRDLAPVMARYHQRLVDEGMTRDEALTMTVAFQMGLFQGRVDDGEGWRE